ncbi:apoptotic chromatin condensation inducer 1b isoform X2 [Brienomyrus brachyistius]|uniref:apoptotic chromatin condensation inducer 1b isoform X2 n=1 Tax=Brienomyrus brachyistius TaxID=42636 RepID=UPI0020B356E8|nr:apoptotic chromatin condensation inducer 1b isoform X2 [Brienomyrus brachyistius]
MAELEDVTLDGKPLHSLRVADLKAALENRGLPKSGQKNALIKRLKGALMLENLQRTSTPHIGLQPNSQIGEEMSQNSFIKQYLAKQQELLRQRLEREAREAAEANEMDSQAAPEEDHEESNLTSCSVEPSLPSGALFSQEEAGGGGELEPTPVQGREEVEGAMPLAVLPRPSTRRSLTQSAQAKQTEAPSTFGSQEALEAGGRSRRSSSGRLSHDEPSRAVASLSVRVVGEPEREGPASAASSSVSQLGRSSLSQDDSEDDEKSDADEEWGAGAARRGPKQSPAPSSLPPQRERSRRKLQPPQHIPPPQLPHQPPLQLRQPTPPPSPPPELSFPLPDTPKQSPPNEPEGGGAAEAMAAAPPALQHQDSSSGSSSSPPSSPESPHQRRPGPLTLLARKMESEGAFAGTRGRSHSEAEGQGSVPTSAAAVSPTTVCADSHSSNAGLPLLPPTGDPVLQSGNGATALEPSSVGSPAQVMETEDSLFPPAEATIIKATSDRQSDGGEPSRPKEDFGKDVVAVKRGKPEEEGKGEPKQEHLGEPSAPGKPTEPLESQLTTVLPKQPPSKKLHLLRNMPVLCVPASTGPPGRQPRASSDEPPGQQPAQNLPSPPAADQDKDGTHDGSTSPSGEAGAVLKPQSAEAEAVCSQSETTDREKGPGSSTGQADARTAKVAEECKMWKGAAVEAPMGPVLPPSPPPEEGDAEPERDRHSSPSSDSSSSDSDSESSSSHSSGSSASSRDQSRSSDKKHDGAKQDSKADSQAEGSTATPRSPCRKRRGEQLEERDAGGVLQLKKPCLGDGKRSKVERKGPDRKSCVPTRELKQAAMSEPADPAVQVEAPLESEGAGVQPRSDGHEAAESHSEESTTPKAFTARKISLNTASKPSVASVGGTTPTLPSPGGPLEPESGGQAARKRRWGSSTAVTAKKPSISITTDSLKSLIPDIKPATGAGSQEAVVELHPDEGHLSGDEEGVERGDQGDQGLEKGLKIRRTVTQVVPAENQENGQKDQEEEEEEDERSESARTVVEEGKNGSSEVSMETQAPSVREADLKKVIPSDSLVRRSISQQKSGVSITIDDPVRSAKQPSPPRGKITNIVHICNLVRPFTLGQLKELLSRTGSVVEEGFWIDKIKSHCYVTYSSTEEAAATRTALHGVKWPQSNPKFLSVDFAEQDELDFHRGLLTVERSAEEERGVPPVAPPAPLARPGTLPPLVPERQRDRGAAVVRDQWAEREREMERRERTRAEREWDRDKVREFSKPREEREGGQRRSRSRERERRRKERAKSKERKTDKKEKAPEEPPAKLLDDLFCKTKTAPCIYWLPLTEEQATQREAERAERMKEREKQRKKLLEEEDKKREEERKERVKAREKEGGAAPGSGVGAAGERERDRGRDREGDKRRDSHRSRGPEAKVGSSGSGMLAGGRRSRSRSNPPARDRRR